MDQYYENVTDIINKKENSKTVGQTNVNTYYILISLNKIICKFVQNYG